jgi:hypothetical protein
VFEEFNELLDLFSRIFIVVNIDTNKRDLESDGSLQPSLESKSPGEVIRAFESLVMSAPLRRAQQQGRLKIYPIDLLNSASAAMKRAMEVPHEDESPVAENVAAEVSPVAAEVAEASPEAADAEVATEESADADDGGVSAAEAAVQAASEQQPLPVVPPISVGPPVVWAPAGSTLPVISEPDGDAAAAPDVKTSVMPASWAEHPETSFALFLRDLTDYLNSSDYLQEFMGDALLMGTNLSSEVQGHCSQKATEALETCQRVLEAELGDTEARLAAVEKLAALDVQASFIPIRDELRKHAEEVSKAAALEARQKALRQLEDWFATDDSVAALQGNWAALVRTCGKRVSSECHSKLRSLMSSPLGGIRIDENQRASMVGLYELLGPAVESARATLGEVEPTLQTVPFQIEPEHLKVRKSLWDWLAFRSLAAVRRRIFGKPEALDHEVPASIKDKRLGEEGRLALEERILSEFSQQFPSEAVRVSESLLARYVETLGKELGDKLRAGKDKYTARWAELTQRIKDNLATRQTLDALSGDAAGVLVEIEKLRRKYHSYSRVTGGLAAINALNAPPAESEAEGEEPTEGAEAEDEPAAESHDEMPEDCGSEDKSEFEDEPESGRSSELGTL